MRLMITWLFVGVLAAYLAGCVFLAVFQRSFLYFPQPAAPNDFGETEKLPIPGQTVLATVRPHEGTDAVIYFGGNAERVALSLPGLAEAFPDSAIHLLHYRGYGGSSGSPSEAALVADALVLFDSVYTTHPHIVVVGRSLGSGVAVRVAAKRPASALVLVTPYNSILELAQRQFPYVPVSWLLVDKYESWRYAPDVRVPTLLIEAELDEVIPASSTEALYARFSSGVASLKVIRGSGHNTISDEPAYIEALAAVARGPIGARDASRSSDP